VGARDLQECLLLQIDMKDMSIPEIALQERSLNIISRNSRKNYEKIITG